MKLEILSRQPANPAPAPPLLFVHGAWHGAWCWEEHFLPYFAERGFAAYALSLRGHGASEGRANLRWARVADYVADVAQVARDLPSAPIVVGHSMGGGVVQRYLEEHHAPAGVLLAALPPAGALATTLRIATRHPWIFARMNFGLTLYPLVETAALVREAFFSAGLSDEAVAHFADRMQDESYLGFLDMVAFARPRPKRVKTPLLVLGGAEDRIFLPKEVAATASAYGIEPVMFAGMAHDLMLEPGWQAVADRMIEWIRGLGST